MNIKVIILFFFLTFSYKADNDFVLIKKGYYTPLFTSEKKLDNDICINYDFYINKYPVTNKEFNLFILNNPEWKADKIKSVFADRNYLIHWKDLNNFEDIEDYSVVNVSWFSAQAYCNYIGGRLPTVDEWEYVASSSKLKKNIKDDLEYNNNILNWYLNIKENKTIKRNDMDNNYWGVYAMHGNIWEWVYDFNSVILLNTDAEGGGLEEVLYCGASATNSIDPKDYVAFMRFAFRNSLEANYAINTLGFRCVKDV